MVAAERGDFLKQDVSTPLRASYLAAGLRLQVETNADSVLHMARRSFEEVASDPAAAGDIRLRLWVEDAPERGAERWRPYFRGLGHMVFFGFDDRSALAINLRDRCGAGRLTAELAGDPGFWRTILFPSFLTVVGPAHGLTSLHCACVAWRGDGLLLAGESGAGKSLLSLALAEAGFDFLADDRTLIGGRRGRLTAWGLSADMKQRAAAAAYFPGLRSIACQQGWEGEPVFRFDPAQLFGVNRISHCRPRWTIFLERRPESRFSLRPIAPEEAARRLAGDLHRQSAEIARRQQRMIGALLKTECRLLRYGGDPHEAAAALRRALARGLQPAAAFFGAPRTPAAAPGAPADPLRRFQATPLSADFSLMGRVVRLESDDPAIIRCVAEVLPRSGVRAPDPPSFRWRIVCDRSEAVDAGWPRRTGFSDRSARYINLGRRGFVAVDLQAREAVGRLPEHLARNEDGFASIFLAGMLHLSAPALGLTAVSAAGVARDESGLLLFGPADSGKSSSSYQATRLGLEFFADQAVFLEAEAGRVYAWGDFWPAAFRPETARFFPELARTGRTFRYRDRTFLCLDKGGPAARRVKPAACIFLERNAAAAPRLIPLRGPERAAQVLTEAGARTERAAALALLRDVPAYRLVYGEDPAAAARCFPDLLAEHRRREKRA